MHVLLQDQAEQPQVVAVKAGVYSHFRSIVIQGCCCSRGATGLSTLLASAWSTKLISAGLSFEWMCL